MLEHFTTNGIAPADKLSFWNAVACRNLAPMHIDAIGSAPFDAELVRIRMQRCELISPRSTAARVKHEPSCQGRFGRLGRPSRLNLQIQHAGSAIYTYDTRELAFAPGDFAILDPDIDYSITFNEPSQMLIVSFLLDSCDERYSRLRDLAGMHCSGDSGAGAILSSFVRSTWQHMRDETAEDLANCFADLVWPLIELAFARGRASLPDLPRGVSRRSQIAAYVGDNLHDPELGSSMIARAFGLTPRSVQLAFAEIATTPGAFILEQRLQRAADELTLRGCDARVTDIAFSLGFNELSHFSRTFRRRFGMTPRDFSRKALQTNLG